MVPVFSAKTRESYEVSLATISRQTSYLPSRQQTQTRFADCDIILIVHLPERTEKGGPNYRIGATDTNVRILSLLI